MPEADPLVLPQRRQHGRVERAAEQITDLDGRISAPFRAVDTLAIMQRRGTLDRDQLAAAEDFRALFRAAHLDPLKSPDIGRVPCHGAPTYLAPRVEGARQETMRRIDRVGGIASSAGSILWHVVGEEQSLTEWSTMRRLAGRRISPEAAAGILIAALDILAGPSRRAPPL